MSNKPLTVGDIRNAIRNLPNTAYVLFADPAFSKDREITGIGPEPRHDGRYGPVLKFVTTRPWYSGQEPHCILEIGGMATDWGSTDYTQFDHDTEPGVEPMPTVYDIPECEFNEELEKQIEQRRR
jgi:hypothetical protein